ncbi:MAG: hypothetical protein IV100_10100 [Myxococcales bacterium]|nr:hypothetical protein [Myxococcales bacterium]
MMGRAVALTVALALAAAAHAEPRRKDFEVGGRPVTVLLPSTGDGPWPVVYLMGGMGELSRGEAVSAASWVGDYEIARVVDAFERGRLSRTTFRNLVTPSSLAAYERRLRRGWGGLVLVGLPAPVDLTRDFERYVVETVIPWAERSLPIRPGAAYRGIDGVSLGGRHALRIGFGNPQLFRSVGAVQGAVRGRQAPLLALVQSRREGCRRLAVNLVTSDGDGYRGAITSFARALRRERLSVRLIELTGPHDYVFNRGPGAIDLLLFHDGVLNGNAAQGKTTR